MAGNDPEKTVLKFFTEKYNTFIQQFERRKTYAWTVANAKFALAIMLLLIFRPSLESWYSEHIAEQYLDITGWAINDWWVIALAVMIVVYGAIRACFGATISGKQAVWTFAALIIYAYYRLFGQLECTFQRINIIDMFAYTDLFALYGAVILGRFIFRLPIQICREYQEYKNPRIGFHYDEPLKHDRATGRIDAETDKLGRAGYAAQIAQTIRQTRSKDAAFAMGITGSWGSGKTSFWRLIEGHLCCDSNIIIIEYRPWQNHGSGVIVKDFFAVLSQQLRPYDSSLSGAVDTYTKILLDADDSTLTKIVKPIRALFCDESTAATEFARINDTLRRIDKQIVIFIDDLDRLDKTEVLDVIRLIRNTANFANIFFVAAYDRGYIMQALEDFNRYNKEAFLEKIFQLEVPLPKFEHRRIIDYLFEILKEKNVLTADDATELTDFISKRPQYERLDVEMNILPYMFDSFRDVNRFANLFIESYKQLKGNVLLEDLFYVELLKYKFPGVYDKVFNKKNEFIESSNTANDKKEYRLKKYPNSKQTVLGSYCKLHFDAVGISVENIPHAICLLQRIFTDENNKGRYAAKYEMSFLRYCFSRLADNNISIITFQNAIEKGYDSFREQINQWLIDRIHYNEIENFLFYTKSISRDAETLAKSQLYYLKKCYNDGDERLIKQLNPIVSFLHGNNQLKDEYLRIMQETLLSAQPVTNFELIFIERLADTIESINSSNRNVITEFSRDYINNLKRELQTKLDAQLTDLFKGSIKVTVQTMEAINEIFLFSNLGFIRSNTHIQAFFDEYVPAQIDDFVKIYTKGSYPFVLKYFDDDIYIDKFLKYLKDEKFAEFESVRKYIEFLNETGNRKI